MEESLLRNMTELAEDKSNIEINSTGFNASEFNIKVETNELRSEDDNNSYSERINVNGETRLINSDQVHYPRLDEFIVNEGNNCIKKINYVDTEEMQEKVFLPVMVKVENADENQLGVSVNHDFVEFSIAEPCIKKEEVEIKSEGANIRDNCEGVVGEATKENIHCCQLCTFITTNRTVFDRHLLTHKTPAKVTEYKCDNCPFITQHKSGLTIHLIKIHGYLSEQKCKFCPYKTKYIGNMKKHELTHKKSSDRAKLKCSMCPFQCLNEQYFKEHLKVHSTDSEIPWYRCTKCPFKTVHRANFKSHNHNLIPGAEPYHCSYCSYKAKLKAALKVHLLEHMDKLEIVTFDCDKCPYKAKCKSRLTVHKKIHKSPLEHEFYKCDTCHYITTQKVNLELHILQHKDKSEVQMYRCDICNFETKYKYWIKDHKKIVHGDPFQMKLYKCKLCPFQCKRGSGLNRHLLSHKNIDETPMYKCFHCPYQTKHKYSLRGHVQTHMDESRRCKYKCEVCGFEVKTKKTIRKHINSCVRNSEMGIIKTEKK